MGYKNPTLISLLERQFDKTNFISPKSTPQKSQGLLGLNTSPSPCVPSFWNRGETEKVEKTYQHQ